MRVERRDFLKTGTARLTLGFVPSAIALAQTSPGKTSGEFEGGTGSVHLEGRLRSGVLILQAQDFIEDKDRALIIHGEFKAGGPGSPTSAVKLYASMFSYNYDRTVFALLRDHDHSTTLVLSDTDDPKIGQLVVWDDTKAPQTFRVDKDRVLSQDDLKESILDGKGSALNLVGERKPPVFTFKELEAVFGNNPALRKFMRGERPGHNPPGTEDPVEWTCRFLGITPGSPLGLFWLAR